MPALLCDLDDTLFDHAAATEAALARLHADEPCLSGCPFPDLLAEHRRILDLIHLDLLHGRRTIDEAREERFRRLVAFAGGSAEHDRPAALAKRYRLAYEASWQPVTGAVDLLTAARAAGYRIAIVTNNLRAEQVAKLAWCALTPLVDELVTSEETRSVKPSREIFDEARRRLDAAATETVMFGDAWDSDVAGAHAAGLRAVWFNRWGHRAPREGVPEVHALVPAATVLSALARR